MRDGFRSTEQAGLFAAEGGLSYKEGAINMLELLRCAYAHA